MNGFIDAAAAALERLVAADEAVEAEYGRRVAPDMFERYEDGQLVSTLIVRGDFGDVAYRIVGMSWADLV